jgi:TatD DNase family protein
LSIEPNNITPWIDSHCHFDFQQFEDDREQHWQFLQSIGCIGLLIPGVTASTWPKLIDVCKNKPWAYALGLHPYFLDQHQLAQSNDCDVEKLKLACQENKPVAIGEFGLDFMMDKSTFTEQIELCQQQFKLAQELNLPVILHVRKAYDEIAAMVRCLGFKQGGIIHAFSGSLQQGETLIKLGFKLGIGGAISHRRAIKLRKTVTQLPMESLVLETDAPDMLPAFMKGKRNTSASILLLAQIIATIKQCSLFQVISVSNYNVNAVIPCLSSVITESK